VLFCSCFAATGAPSPPGLLIRDYSSNKEAVCKKKFLFADSPTCSSSIIAIIKRADLTPARRVILIHVALGACGRGQEYNYNQEVKGESAQPAVLVLSKVLTAVSAGSLATTRRPSRAFRRGTFSTLAVPTLKPTQTDASHQGAQASMTCLSAD